MGYILYNAFSVHVGDVGMLTRLVETIVPRIGRAKTMATIRGRSAVTMSAKEAAAISRWRPILQRASRAVSEIFATIAGFTEIQHQQKTLKALPPCR